MCLVGAKIERYQNEHGSLLNICPLRVELYCISLTDGIYGPASGCIYSLLPLKPFRQAINYDPLSCSWLEGGGGGISAGHNFGPAWHEVFFHLGGQTWQDKQMLAWNF